MSEYEGRTQRSNQRMEAGIVYIMDMSTCEGYTHEYYFAILSLIMSQRDIALTI